MIMITIEVFDMEKDKILEIATKKGVVDKNVFVKFIQLRFPDEQFDGYIEEWCDRFNTGDPTGYMDDYSKSSYVQAKKDGGI